MKQLKYFSALLFTVIYMSFLGCASTPKEEGTAEYVDDSVITTKVKALILKEPGLKVAQINVETYKGIVQLSGFVTSKTAKNEAVELARGVKGVKSVKDDMVLR